MNNKSKIYLHFENVPVEEYDISLANRLLMWESVSYLNQINGKNHNVYLERDFYQDLDDLVFFPETFFYDENYIELQRKNKNLINNGKKLIKLDNQSVKDYFQKKKLLEPDSDYYIVFTGVQTYFHFDIETPHPRLLHHVTFHNFIHKTVRERINSTIAIHVRRGDGVEFPEQFYFNLTDKAKSFVKRGFYKFYDDSYYFPIIEKIHSINPHQSFYIAHDLTDMDMEYWQEKYGNKQILFNTSLFSDIFKYFHNRPFYVISAIIDLLFLIESDVKILNPESTYSQIPYHDTDEKKIKYMLQPNQPNPTREINKFINLYKRFLEKNNLTLTK